MTTMQGFPVLDVSGLTGSVLCDWKISKGLRNHGGGLPCGGKSTRGTYGTAHKELCVLALLITWDNVRKCHRLGSFLAEAFRGQKVQGQVATSRPGKDTIKWYLLSESSHSERGE